MTRFKSKLKYFVTVIYMTFLILVVSTIILFLTLVSMDKIFYRTQNKSKANESVEIVSGKNQVKSDFSEWNKYCDWNLKVINNQNEMSKDYELNLKNCRGIPVDARIRERLEDMIQGASSQNVKLWISSGYRSLEKQSELFANKVNEYKNKGYTDIDATNLAQGVVARPSTSEHNMGIAVDLNGVKDDFCYSEEYKWLMENSHNYGFVLRYDNDKQSITGKIYEPWHFRYVGEDHAKEMKEKNLCLEEYVMFLSMEY